MSPVLRAKLHSLLPALFLLGSVSGFAAPARTSGPCLDQVMQDLTRTSTPISDRLVALISPSLPEDFYISAENLLPLSPKNLKAIRESKVDAYSYIWDQEGQLHLVQGLLQIPKPGSTYLLRDKGRADQPAILVKEAGTIRAVRETKNGTLARIEREPKFADAATEEDLKKIARAIEETHPDIKMREASKKILPKGQVLNCIDILAAHGSFKHFLEKRLLADNFILGAKIIIDESLSDKNETDEAAKKRHQQQLADFLGNNASNIIGSYASSWLINRKIPLHFDYSARVAIGVLLQSFVRAPINHAVIEDTKQEFDTDLFNAIHFLAWIPISRKFDQFMIKDLAAHLSAACLRDSSIQVHLSPTRIRIAERMFSGTIYLAARTLFLDE